MKNKNNFCVIMAGGVGSRFWPISKISKPKQFLDILNTGKTLIQQTFERFEYFCPAENILIVTSQEYLSVVYEQLPNISKEQVLFEPARKNTAPCIAYANEKIRKINANANIIVAPADHIILNEDKFQKIISRGLLFVEQNESLATIGIKPTTPNTGYGYIQFEENDGEKDNIYKVKTFTEKPNLELAKIFLQSGDFLWNSGIFLWKLNTISTAFETFLPDVTSLFVKYRNASDTEQENAVIQAIYPVCKSISIDYGIMEKAENVYVIVADFGWSDLGSWGSMFEHSIKNEANNTETGSNVFSYETTNSVIHVDKNKIAVIQGLDNYIVVSTGDCLLICNKSEEQKLKDIVSDIEDRFGDKYI